MSNKNLKVYKILFITQVKTLHLNVKFPCDVKMTWKRSNQLAETERAKLVDGKAEFNQTLKLNVNMYFDIKTNKFVQKKCIYSFLIFTQKGEKSAGSVTFDLSDFFNKRLYDVQDSFVLQKCPVKDTKIDMKIYYEQSIQSGYDSMSQISAISQLDESASNPLDLSQLKQQKDDQSQKSNSTIEGLRLVKAKAQVKVQTELAKYEGLNESDVDGQQFKSREIITQKKIEYQGDQGSRQNKIGYNIKGIQQVTHKLNDFVGKFKQNLSYDLEQRKRKINQLTEELQAINQLNKRLQSQLKEQKTLKQQIQITLTSITTNSSQNWSQKSRRIQQLQRKLDQEKKNIDKLQKRLTDASQRGDGEGKYIQQLKQQFSTQQQLLKEQNQKVSKQLIYQKSQTSEFQSKCKRTEQSYNELNERYDRLVNKYESLEKDIRKRQEQIQQTRINLDTAVQNLMQSLATML